MVIRGKGWIESGRDVSRGENSRGPQKRFRVRKGLGFKACEGVVFGGGLVGEREGGSDGDGVGDGVVSEGGMDWDEVMIEPGEDDFLFFRFGNSRVRDSWRGVVGDPSSGSGVGYGGGCSEFRIDKSLDDREGSVFVLVGVFLFVVVVFLFVGGRVSDVSCDLDLDLTDTLE